MEVPFVSFRSIEHELYDKLQGAFSRVINRSWYILGEEDRLFEEAYSKYCGTKYCIGCGNGLDALTLILSAYDIGEGDEVIVPSNTFIATVLAISRVGAKPVLVEPRLDTYTIDTERIEEKFQKIRKQLLQFIYTDNQLIWMK